MRFIDLHVHTTASDGTISPEILPTLALEHGLSAVSVTDHDTADGVKPALEAAEKAGIELIPGVELSALFEGMHIHLLGYFIDPDSDVLKKVTDDAVLSRQTRNKLMVQLLADDGFDISWEELTDAFPTAIVGRPHIAEILVRHGYEHSVKAAFEKYLSTTSKYYRPRQYMQLEETIGVIKEAGGKVVIAHPLIYGFSEDKLMRLISSASELGAKGIEAYYSEFSAEQSDYLLGLAKHFGLVPTGGSDWHGARKPEISLGSGKGQLKIPYSLLEALKQS